MRGRRLAAAVVALAALAATPGEAARRRSPAFRLSNTGAFAPEVTLGVQRDGDIFVGGWDYVVKSDDDGRSWTRIGPDIASVGPVVAADRVLVVDKGTARVFVDDTDLACTVLWWSDDDGDSWTVNPIACGGGVTDHEQVAVGKRTAVPDPTGLLYPNVVYVCANGLTHTPCAASFDGGRTFGPGVPAGGVDAEEGTVVPGCAFQGVPLGAPDGTVYQPLIGCGPEVAWSEDNGFTWRRAAVFTGPNAGSPDTPDMAATPNGTLYYFWTRADWSLALARSKDGGRTWSAPIRVSVPGLRSALFPVITAGDDGRIGLAFYGTTDAPSGWNGNPGDAPSSVRWRLYAAVVTNAEAASPAIAPVVATPSPVQTGCLSKLGSCEENIADYIDIDSMPNGRLAISYVNGCVPTCAAKSSSAFVAVQTAGPTLKAPRARRGR